MLCHDMSTKPLFTFTPLPTKVAQKRPLLRVDKNMGLQFIICLERLWTGAAREWPLCRVDQHVPFNIENKHTTCGARVLPSIRLPQQLLCAMELFLVILQAHFRKIRLIANVALVRSVIVVDLGVPLQG